MGFDVNRKLRNLKRLSVNQANQVILHRFEVRCRVHIKSARATCQARRRVKRKFGAEVLDAYNIPMRSVNGPKQSTCEAKKGKQFMTDVAGSTFICHSANFFRKDDRPCSCESMLVPAPM